MVIIIIIVLVIIMIIMIIIIIVIVMRPEGLKKAKKYESLSTAVLPQSKS